MSQPKKLLANYLVCLTILAFMPVGLAASYNFVTLEVPNSAPGSTKPTAINNHGQVVGIYLDTQRIQGTHGFLYSEGKYTLLDAVKFDINGIRLPLPDMGGETTTPTAINDNGQIVGNYTYYDVTGTFIYQNGTLATLPNHDVQLYGISDSGQLLGTYLSSANYHVIDGEKAYSVPEPPYEDGVIYSSIGFNVSGQMAGVMIVSSNKHFVPYIYNGRAFITQEVPNILLGSVSVMGISDRGQAIGTFQDIKNIFHIFTYDGSSLATLDLDANKYQPTGLNAKGQIIGTYDDADPKKTNGFIATPSDMVASTCPPVNASFNIWSHDLILRDVVFNGQHYWAKLADQGNNQFKLIDAHAITASMCKDNEVIHFQDKIVTIPNVSIYGVNSQATLEQIGAELQFRVQNISKN
jgi:probable HAF family extracellular repeat protein